MIDRQATDAHGESTDYSPYRNRAEFRRACRAAAAEELGRLANDIEHDEFDHAGAANVREIAAMYRHFNALERIQERQDACGAD